VPLKGLPSRQFTDGGWLLMPDQSLVVLKEIMEEFAEWLEDGAGRHILKVFDPDWIKNDERSWDDLIDEFLTHYAEQRVARD
jgi:hypothetical protein